MMSRLTRLCVCVISVGCVASLSGQAPPATATQAPVRHEALWPQAAVQQWQSIRGLLEKMAERMPAEHYRFRPTPDMRTFAANVAHIVSANVNQCSNLLGRKHPLAGQPLETTLTEKAELVAALTATSDFCGEYFAALTTGAQLTDRFFETSMTRDGVRTEFKAAHGVIVSALLGHNNEMYGYMAVYLRLKGLVPPSSERAAAGAPALVVAFR